MAHGSRLMLLLACLRTQYNASLLYVLGALHIPSSTALLLDGGWLLMGREVPRPWSFLRPRIRILNVLKYIWNNFGAACDLSTS